MTNLDILDQITFPQVDQRGGSIIGRRVGEDFVLTLRRPPGEDNLDDFLIVRLALNENPEGGYALFLAQIHGWTDAINGDEWEATVTQCLRVVN
jgi:hypothetical protein